MFKKMLIVTMGVAGILAWNAKPAESGARHRPATPALTNQVVESIGEVERYCGSLSAEYRISCLGEGFDSISSQMPRTLDYGEARASIRRVGRNLQRIASENADRSKPKLSGPTSKKWAKRKKYTAVQKSQLRAANTAAIAVIEEARTELLRSAEASKRRRVHYVRIAKAVGSTKRILRSS